MKISGLIVLFIYLTVCETKNCKDNNVILSLAKEVAVVLLPILKETTTELLQCDNQDLSFFQINYKLPAYYRNCHTVGETRECRIENCTYQVTKKSHTIMKEIDETHLMKTYKEFINHDDALDDAVNYLSEKNMLDSEGGDETLIDSNEVNTTKIDVHEDIDKIGKSNNGLKQILVRNAPVVPYLTKNRNGLPVLNRVSEDSQEILQIPVHSADLNPKQITEEDPNSNQLYTNEKQEYPIARNSLSKHTIYRKPFGTDSNSEMEYGKQELSIIQNSPIKHTIYRKPNLVLKSEDLDLDKIFEDTVNNGHKTILIETPKISLRLQRIEELLLIKDNISEL